MNTDNSNAVWMSTDMNEEEFTYHSLHKLKITYKMLCVNMDSYEAARKAVINEMNLVDVEEVLNS